jgi:hypothetical protein
MLVFDTCLYGEQKQSSASALRPIFREILMPNVGPTILDSAREFGTSILRSRSDIPSFELFGNTSKHMIFKATTQDGRLLCLKVNLRAFEPQEDDKAVPPDRTELNAFAIAGDNAAWVPRIVDSCQDARWLLREWVGEYTSNQIKKADWTKQRLDGFWALFADAFEAFHDRSNPYLIRDIKPTNVSYDTQRFFMFDFNTTKSLEQVRRSSVGSRLGNRSNRYAPPEILRGDFSSLALNADYFGFAAVFQRYATGLSESVWSNSMRDEVEAMATYQKEYQALRTPTELALLGLGYSKSEIAFLIACLNPLSEQFVRPV